MTCALRITYFFHAANRNPASMIKSLSSEIPPSYTFCADYRTRTSFLYLCPVDQSPESEYPLSNRLSATEPRKRKALFGIISRTRSRRNTIAVGGNSRRVRLSWAAFRRVRVRLCLSVGNIWTSVEIFLVGVRCRWVAGRVWWCRMSCLMMSSL